MVCISSSREEHTLAADCPNMEITCNGWFKTLLGCKATLVYIGNYGMAGRKLPDPKTGKVPNQIRALRLAPSCTMPDPDPLNSGSQIYALQGSLLSPVGLTGAPAPNSPDTTGPVPSNNLTDTTVASRHKQPPLFPFLCKALLVKLPNAKTHRGSITKLLE